MNDQAPDACFLFTNGPRNARVLLVGEAWGATEARAKQPFVGSAGQELNLLLQAAGLRRSDILCANLVDAQPEKNDFTKFLYSQDEVKAAKKAKTPLRDLDGIFPRPILWNGIHKLQQLISRVEPDIIIAAGNWPLHILTNHTNAKTSKGFKLPTGITNWRGSQTFTREIHGTLYPCLPIIHPAAIVREQGWRPVTIHDLRSRLGRYLSKELFWPAPPSNTLWNPTFLDIERLFNLWMAKACHSGLWLSVDIETQRKKFITVLGMADADVELCIPFFHKQAGQFINRWTADEEKQIWLRARTLLTHPGTKIIGQNFIYDTQFLKRTYDIDAIVQFDTMVAHHLLFPGTPKGLHNLASLYCNHYSYWKDESQDHTGEEDTLPEIAWKYNCKDTRATYEIAMELRTQISKADGFNCEDSRAANSQEVLIAGGMWEQYKQRMDEWVLAREMTLVGLNYDDKVRKEFQLDVFKQISKLESWLLSCMPERAAYSSTGTPWYNSPTHAATLFYSYLGITPILHKKTKRPTLDDSAINTLSERKELAWFHPVLERLRALRSAQVFRGNFLDCALGPTKRFHAQFNIAQPETFRWSSSSNAFDEGTNLQNTPKVED